MVIKDPNNMVYDGKILSSSTTDVLTFRDTDLLDVFRNWREKYPQIEILQMEIIPVPTTEELSGGEEIPTLENLVVMQIKSAELEYDYPSGKEILW